MRTDISQWVIHFIHRRNPETDPAFFSAEPDTFEPLDQPDGFTYAGKPLFLSPQYDNDWNLEPDASAFGVLRKILHDGFLKAGWSYRRTKAGLLPTIYGPKAAVCFTEMPLHGLIDYAITRNSELTVQNYGLAFLRNELFEAGARPVIYGTSSPHREADKNDSFGGIGLRTLHSSLGIGLREQYRYVATNLTRKTKMDWTHEREWRWADVNERFEEPGMAFFLQNGSYSFSKLIILVQSDKEAKQIVGELRNLYDAGSNNYDRDYDRALISNTGVLSFESLSKLRVDMQKVRLDDLPLQSIPKIKQVIVEAATLKKVKEAVEEAKRVAHAASQELFTKNGDSGPAGFSNLATHDGHSEITQALLQLEHATVVEGSYLLCSITNFPVQSMDVNEAGARAAAKYLTEALGQPFYVRTVWD
ncbi:hypothetical protein F1C16_22045 (plasmid) [Hymenobacter sp. NBH84]|uniref:hypothetical protein n=1 Tax=Hymenobacter sp. NBH84 TaxID=2596915 RepID=UPI001624943F|nr:hypothetical protein [Hymenobacter sp. NBH84]QNE42308.1 hypothetical protein F1C16_22045 [Hymenobacter sp. NBH84]